MCAFYIVVWVSLATSTAVFIGALLSGTVITHICFLTTKQTGAKKITHIIVVRV